MERKIIPQNPWNCVNFKLRSCYAINFDVEENAKERLNPRKVIHQVPSTDIRGFQIDNCVFQSQSPLYGRVSKKYDIYRNNNKKTWLLSKIETVGTKFFFL